MGELLSQQNSALERPKVSCVDRPTVDLLLAVDHVYRRHAKAGVLLLVALHGDEDRRVPVLSMRYAGWRFTVHYEHTGDGVVVRYQNVRQPRSFIATVTTVITGRLAGKRVVPHRMEECVAYYRRIASVRKRVPSSVRTAAAFAFTALALPLASAPLHVSEHIRDQTQALQLCQVDTMDLSSCAADMDASILQVREPNPPNTGPRVDECYPFITFGYQTTAINGIGKSNGESAVEGSGANVESFDLVWRWDIGPTTGGQNRVADIMQKQPGTQTVLHKRPGNSARRENLAELRLESSASKDRILVQDLGTSPAQDVHHKQVPSVRERNQGNPATSLTTAFRDGRDSNLGVTSNPGNQHAYWDMKMNSSLVGGRLVTISQLAFSSVDPYLRPEVEDARHRAMQFELKGALREFGYGIRYRSTGNEFDPLTKERKKFKNKDHSSWETWGSWWSGKFGLSTAYVEKENNRHANPDKPRFRDEQGRVTFTHALTDWPYLGYSLSYGTGKRTSFREPSDYRPYEGSMNQVTGSLSYSTDTWDTSLSSYHVETKEALDSGRDSTLIGHTISTSYYPGSGFSLSPFLAISDEFYANDNAHTENWSLGLSLFRAMARGRVNINAYAMRYSDRNKTWNWDNDGVYAESGISWSVGESSESSRSIGLHLTYNRYKDNVYEDGSVSDAVVWVTFRQNVKRPTFFNSTYRILFESDMDR